MPNDNNAQTPTLAVPVWRTHNASSSSLRRPRILVVDDSAVFRNQLSIWLSSAGFNVNNAMDGQEGFEMLSGSGRFDLALVDHNMPKMNGIEMVEALRLHWAKSAQPNGKNPMKIFMLTAENDAALVHRAKAAGVDGWIIKPSKQERVVAAVQKLTGYVMEKSAS